MTTVNTDDAPALVVLMELARCAAQLEQDVRVMGNVRAIDVVKAIVEVAGVIGEVRGLLEEAIDTHIYDKSNGDHIPEDCAYHRAVQDIEAMMGKVERKPGEPSLSQKLVWSALVSLERINSHNPDERLDEAQHLMLQAANLLDGSAEDSPVHTGQAGV